MVLAKYEISYFANSMNKKKYRKGNNKLKIPNLNRTINFYDFQYLDGYFIKTTSFIKQKNKPNIPYDFSFSMQYCKCCDIVKRLSYSKNNKTYIWIYSSESPNKDIVNFKLQDNEYIFCDYEEMENILKIERIII